MTDKHCVMLITGTRKGIGKYLVEYYADKGFNVIGCSRGNNEYEIKGYKHFCLDVADENAVKKMFNTIRKDYGRLDILINNAGIASMNHILLTPKKTVEKIFNTNVIGTFLFCREAAKLMKKKDCGRIVNFATVATPLKLEGEAIYAASKAAIVSLTEIMAKELADMNITVNAVGPTPIKTDLIRSVQKIKLKHYLECNLLNDLESLKTFLILLIFLFLKTVILLRASSLSRRDIMHIDFLINVFKKNRKKDAIVWKDKIYRYEWLLEKISYWYEKIKKENISCGTVTIIEADFSPNAIALFLALIKHSCIIVPLTNSIESKKKDFIKIAQGEIAFTINSNDQLKIKKLQYLSNNKLYKQLQNLNHPGLVLFSSGSTGKSKAIVHDITKLLEKFKVKRLNLRTLTFLLFDHIGGIDTLLYSLSNGSCIITISNYLPDTICSSIEKYQVEVLPVSPTFLNLLILSNAYVRYNLSSLKYITYGAEVMPHTTLNRCADIFSNVTILQKYGTTEVGTLRSKSKNSSSLYVRIGGEGFKTRIIEGVLHIKAKSSMLGYLNSPNPFSKDGWFNTGDIVEKKGEYIKILGRQSEIINVGGEKVYPAEVENVIQEMPNVKEIVVYGEKNQIIGNIVCANVSLLKNEDKKQFVSNLKKFCKNRLEAYKIPIKIKIVDIKQHSNRFKKKRILH